MTTCPSCGQENPAGFRLCGMCGTPLAGDEPASRELRKTVTVVFADVSGSTALGERLDPESLRRAMNRYFDAARTALARHGGTVEKFIGDAVVAVFGIPVLHEDDAVRAVRAAAELREALVPVNADLRRDYGVELELRIGVNTGEVVAGEASRGQGFATGDAVNVAARLEQGAQPGETLLGEATYHLVRDAVDAELLPPFDAKGKSEPLTAFRLTGIRPDAPGRARRADAAMVGRETELRRLRAAFEQAVEDPSCQLFTVLGAAGVGKSRLVREFLGSLDESTRVLRGRCLPYGDGITFWPLAEALNDAAGLDRADSADEARVKIAALVEGEEHAELIVHGTAELLGLAGAHGSTEEAFWAVRRLFEALARDRPLVVVFDDLHWAEPTFLDLVEHVADWSRNAPLLVLCLARRELLDARAVWGGGKLNATSVLLEPLSQEESERLTDELLGAAGLEDEARARIAAAADGNPLFVEELVAMLLEEGVIERRNGEWRTTRDLAALSVPPTVSALLAARLDRLSAAEREVLEVAAIEGKVFHVGAVATLAPEPVRASVRAHLLTLVRKELLRPDRAAFAGEDAFRFRHLLIRDVAYEALPKERRAELHETFAAWLEGKVGDRLAEYEEIVGFHLEQAARYLSELGRPDERARRLADAAAERLLASGRRAFTRGDIPAATNLFGRGCALAVDEATRLEAQPDFAAALIVGGEFARADAVLTEAIETAESTGNERIRGHALLRRFHIVMQTDPEQDVREIRAETESLIPVFEGLGDDVGLARAWHALGKIVMWTGESDAAVAAFERSLAAADRAGLAVEKQDALSWIPWPLLTGTLPVEEALRRCGELRRSVVPGSYADVSVRMIQAQLEAMAERFDEAHADVAAARRTVREFGYVLEWAGSSMVAGMVGLLGGDAAAAEADLREGYDELRRIGETGYLSTVAGYLAEALLRQGKFEAALEMSRDAEEAAGRWDLESQVLWRMARAGVLARRGNTAEAERLAREAIARSEPTERLTLLADAYSTLADVLRLAARADEASSALREALALYERKGDLASATRVRSVLDGTRTS